MATDFSVANFFVNISMIDLYFFERTLCDYSIDWLKEIVKIDNFNNYGSFKTCNDINVPEPKNPCIIISNCHSEYLSFIEKLQNKNINFGVVQLSDETLADVFHFTSSDNCKFVARNYIHHHVIYNEKIFHFGLGYVKGFTNTFTDTPFSQRELTWSFAGAIRETPGYSNYDRVHCIKTFKHLKPNLTLNVCGFSNPNRYRAEDYRSLMDKSKFSLCPFGHSNNDTFRIYESLEAGCIPVVLRNTPFKLGTKFFPSYWHSVFRKLQSDNVMPFLEPAFSTNYMWNVTGEIEDIPFVIEDTWEECYEKVNKILIDKQGDAIQSQCISFWKKWKDYWSITFERNINKLNK